MSITEAQLLDKLKQNQGAFNRSDTPEVATVVSATELNYKGEILTDGSFVNVTGRELVVGDTVFIEQVDVDTWIVIGKPGINTSLLANFLLAAHPVHSLYWSSDPTDPGTLFGGTWVQIKDRFILAAGDTYTAGATGGAKEVTLTAAQSGLPAHHHTVPQHRHNMGTYWSTGTGSDTAYTMTSNRKVDNTRYTEYQEAFNTTDNTAANATAAHGNMPPYKVFYCWERTA